MVDKAVAAFPKIRGVATEGVSEIREGSASRSSKGDTPAEAGLQQSSAVKSGNQPRADERRFPGAGQPQDGDEAIAGKAIEQVENLLVASEEEVTLIGFKWTEARIRVFKLGEAFQDRGETHARPA
jgi:hypothetical protein